MLTTAWSRVSFLDASSPAPFLECFGGILWQDGGAWDLSYRPCSPAFSVKGGRSRDMTPLAEAEAGGVCVCCLLSDQRGYRGEAPVVTNRH